MSEWPEPPMDKPKSKTVTLEVELPENVMPLAGVVCLNCVDEQFREMVFTLPYGKSTTERIGLLTIGLDWNRRLISDNMVGSGGTPEHG